MGSDIVHATRTLILSEYISLVLMNICYTNAVVISMTTSSRHKTYLEQFDLLYVNGKTLLQLKCDIRKVLHQTVFYIMWICAGNTAIFLTGMMMPVKITNLIISSWAFSIPGFLEIYIKCLGQFVDNLFASIRVELQKLFDKRETANHFGRYFGIV